MAGRRRVPCIISYAEVSRDETFLKTIPIETGFWKDSILCQENTYLLELVRYIHLNPIRAGIVKDLKSLGRYACTGHSIIVGKRKNPFGGQ
jgi:deoxycytidine triphosphate deaminase